MRSVCAPGRTYIHSAPANRIDFFREDIARAIRLDHSTDQVDHASSRHRQVYLRAATLTRHLDSGATPISNPGRLKQGFPSAGLNGFSNPNLVTQTENEGIFTGNILTNFQQRRWKISQMTEPNIHANFRFPHATMRHPR